MRLFKKLQVSLQSRKVLGSNERREVVSLLYESLSTEEKLKFDADEHDIDVGCSFQPTCFEYEEDFRPNTNFLSWIDKIKMRLKVILETMEMMVKIVFRRVRIVRLVTIVRRMKKMRRMRMTRIMTRKMRTIRK